MTENEVRPTIATERARRGRTSYALRFGLGETTAEQLMTERAGETYVAEAYEAAGGPGWHGHALTERDRAIAVITAFVSGGIIDDRLEVYLNLARRNGIDNDGLTQLMILLTAYIGQPHPSAAMRTIHSGRQRCSDAAAERG